MDNPLSETVLITGITGFLGSQIANNLLNRGFKVKGTMLVLKAAAKNDKIKHIVITSSIESIFSSYTTGSKTYTEDDWPNMDKLKPYNKSKALAEKEAWKFYEKEKEIREKSNKKMFKLTTICPGYIFGPSLVKTGFASGDIIKQILTGELIGIPNVKFSVVDVRDCAESHIRAMLSDISDGQRYICVTDKGLWARDVSKLLRDNYKKYGYKCTKMNVPNFLIHMTSVFNGQAAATSSLLNADNNFDNSKIKKDLKITFRTAEEAILSMAKSLIDLGIVKNLIGNQSQLPK